MQRIALALMSGGLDSTLAAKLMVDQGIQVEGLYLSSPWGCDTEVKRVSEELGVPLTIVEKGREYLELVRTPRFGYGKNMNPCIDCRIFMFEIAKRVMGEMKADFVVTGEVLGQRPMSQRRDAMVKIDQESGMAGLVLRPLSAKHLPPTLPEQEGWVNREQLLDVIGRSRQIQLRLARDLELKEFGAPAGGCLLTDAEFSVKLRDFFAHTPDPSMAEARLLRYGRHFRVDDRVKVVLGRHEEENKILLELADQMMTVVEPVGFPGPVAVVTDPSDNDLLEMVGAMILRYSKKAGDGVHRFSYRRGSDHGEFSIEKSFTGSIPEPIHLGSDLLRIQG